MTINRLICVPKIVLKEIVQQKTFNPRDEKEKNLILGATLGQVKVVLGHSKVQKNLLLMFFCVKIFGRLYLIKFHEQENERK